MKQLCLALAFCIGILGCKNPASPSQGTLGDSGSVAIVGADSVVGQGKPVQGKVAIPDSGEVHGILGSLKDMSLEEGLSLDDFRVRLEQDRGDVHAILAGGDGTFQPEGEDFLVLKGEIKQSGFPWAAIMVLDLKQDAVFAAQYDGENKRFDQFEEEKEGLKQPAPLTTWMKKYQ